MIEICKNIATVIGCITTCAAFILAIIKPIRAAVKRWVKGIANNSESSITIKDAIQNLDIKMDARMDKIEEDIDGQKESLETITERIETLERRITKDEIHKMREVLYSCFDRCVRGEYMSSHSMDYLNEVYHVYHDILGANSSGTKCYEFCVEYYEEQCKKEYQKKNDNTQL